MIDLKWSMGEYLLLFGRQGTLLLDEGRQPVWGRVIPRVHPVLDTDNNMSTGPVQRWSLDAPRIIQ